MFGLTMLEIAIFAALFVAQALYGLFLWRGFGGRVHDFYFPDHIYGAVAGGVLITVAAPIALARLVDYAATWQQYELWTAIAFSVSAVPIIAIEGIKIAERRDQEAV